MGLGNPGPEYEATRHNAGWLLLDRIAARWGCGTFRRDLQARSADCRWADQPVRLIKPQTYMNRSGAALAPLLGRPGFDPASDLLVVVDDVALPLGRFRLRGAGSPGGHNGLKSIQGVLRRQDYPRLRIGVGLKPPEWNDLSDFVLGRFSPDERRALDELLDPMADAVECWVADGIEAAMQRYNR